MAIAPHIARLRAKVGHDLLLLPSVAVLPVDEQDRVLLVRHRESGTFGTIGGAVDEDESPADAARREALEEIGTEVVLTGLLGAVGGPQFRITYPNGDQTAYVTTIYQARIPNPAAVTPDGDEVDQTQWFHRHELRSAPQIGGFARETFIAIDWI